MEIRSPFLRRCCSSRALIFRSALTWLAEESFLEASLLIVVDAVGVLTEKWRLPNDAPDDLKSLFFKSRETFVCCRALRAI